MPRVLAFDVNETLLDLSALDPHFESAFGDAALRGQWFAQMLQLAFVGGLTRSYVNFSEAQRAALEMLARRTGRTVDEGTAAQIAATMRNLPSHPEVAGALARLGDAGFRLVALTNSTAEVAHDQLANAGLAGHFDDAISSDEIRSLKPAPAPYHLVAERSEVPIGEVRLIAAHAWDVAGALAAGCSAAFVARPGMVLSPLGPQPDVVGADLDEVAAKILALDGQ
ncbi:MAG: haloacid dehalogenase type II [Solirubrobacterales bacterium]|nr:haloacid dehalogenase type II [Solirubrobacterales bacterium]